MNKNKSNPYLYQFSPDEIRMSILPHLTESLALLNEIDKNEKEYSSIVHEYDEMHELNTYDSIIDRIIFVIGIFFHILFSTIKFFFVITIILSILKDIIPGLLLLFTPIKDFIFSKIDLPEALYGNFVFAICFLTLCYFVISVFFWVFIQKYWIKEEKELELNRGKKSSDLLDIWDAYDGDLNYLPSQYQNPEAIKYFINYFKNNTTYHPSFKTCFDAYEEHKKKKLNDINSSFVNM